MTRGALLAAVTVLLHAAPGWSQEPDTVRAPPRGGAADTGAAQAQETRVSPGGAFLRSMLVPGWGHAAVGSYTRGGFYFAAESASGGMLLKSLVRRGAAEDLVELRRDAAEARLRAEGRQDPDSIRVLVDQDPEVQEAEGLVEARSQQVEDWAALAIFLLFMGAADAFVSAHLQDFPEPLEVRVVGDGDRVEMRISVPVGPGGL